MTTILLIIIYLAFISLGLPDSLIGVTFPAIQSEFGLSLQSAGYIATTLAIATIISSFMSGSVINKFGTGKTTFFSCTMTATAILLMSYSTSFIVLILLAIPLGLGAGAVDTALNNYVSINYKAHHLNWLHSFWGIGATLGPLVLGKSIASSGSWRVGYQSIGAIQLALSLVLLLSLPLWKHHQNTISKDNESPHNSTENILVEKSTVVKNTSMISNFKIKGFSFSCLTFFFYNACEVSVGLWGSAYLIHRHALSIKDAAFLIALYYGGITGGRILSGFISFKLSNHQLIICGISASLLGIISILFVPVSLLSISYIIIGVGLAPIFPSMIHETPKRFGENNSQVLMGYQMGFAYMGVATLPPLFGYIMASTSLIIYPLLLLITLLMILISYKLVIK